MTEGGVRAEMRCGLLPILPLVTGRAPTLTHRPMYGRGAERLAKDGLLKLARRERPLQAEGARQTLKYICYFHHRTLPVWIMWSRGEPMAYGVVKASSKPLLHKFPGITTGSADEVSVALSPFFGKAVVEPARARAAFRLQLNICRLERMSLSYSASPEPFKIDAAENSYFLHGFPVRGFAEHRNNGAVVAESPNRGAVGEPGSLNLSFGPNFALFAVFLNQASVSEVLSGLIGAPASRNLKLDRVGYHERQEAPMIRGLARLLIGELDREDCEVSPVLSAEIQQAIIVAYLSGVAHNYSNLFNQPNKKISSWQVKRAEEYMEANWREPISVEALAIVTNVSARSLFHAFREYRGYSPMGFVKRLRLRHANAMLTNPESDTSVTKVSFECGFGNLGHFAMDYKKIFAEAPSETLHRARLVRFIATEGKHAGSINLMDIW
jgi:AraC-like DNA-binding protein